MYMPGDCLSSNRDTCPPDPEFRNIIDATPLVSVDLLVTNTGGELLLGKRVNRPAKGFWFVPGGRIRKNETIEDAILRVSLAELGVGLNRADGHLVGAYDHIYDDNYWGDTDVNTHYVALAFAFNVAHSILLTGDAQHDALEWWKIADMLSSKDVHENTKAYYRDRKNL